MIVKRTPTHCLISFHSQSTLKALVVNERSKKDPRNIELEVIAIGAESRGTKALRRN